MSACQSSFSDRLKEERQRLGLNQTAFGALAGASRRAMINWESGKSAPQTTALTAWAEAGADAVYILTGQRTVERPDNAGTQIEDQLEGIRQQPSIGTVAGRLKAERQRLGLSVAEMAAVVGVREDYQACREYGEVPLYAESLAALHKAGVDVLFVVTGQRQQTDRSELLAAQAQVVQAVLARLAPDERQRVILDLLTGEAAR